MKALKTDALSGTTDWTAQCGKCHPFHSGGSVTIANNATVGINYTANGGVHLGGSSTTGTTEAQICWNCHDNAANSVSEWGTNTKQAGAPARSTPSTTAPCLRRTGPRPLGRAPSRRSSHTRPAPSSPPTR